MGLHEKIDGFKANVRDTDRKVPSMVSDRYKVVQNTDAFSFTDELLGKGVRFETARSLQEGKRYDRLQSFRGNISSQESGSAPIWYFLIPMTVLVLSKWWSPRSGWYATIP